MRILSKRRDINEVVSSLCIMKGVFCILLCSLVLTGCGLIGVNQIAPAPHGVDVNSAMAPDGIRPEK